jgi:hypothetical protein
MPPPAWVAAFLRPRASTFHQRTYPGSRLSTDWRQWALEPVRVRDAPSVNTNYSYLNATIGSTMAARLAGIHAALNAIPANTAASSPYVQGSVALNP